MVRKPKFSVGQVVRINTPYYSKVHRYQQYQRITRRWSWAGCKAPFGYTFLNGDQANEKYLAPLTAKELGKEKP